MLPGGLGASEITMIALLTHAGMPAPEDSRWQAWRRDRVTAFVRGSDVPRDLPGADTIYGGDFLYKWKSARAEGGFPFVKWQTEAMYRRFEAGRGLDDSFPVSETFDDWGMYSQVLWGFKKGWVAGMRGDRPGCRGLRASASCRSRFGALCTTGALAERRRDRAPEPALAAGPCLRNRRARSIRGSCICSRARRRRIVASAGPTGRLFGVRVAARLPVGLSRGEGSGRPLSQAGSRVAIVSNAGGAGALAADACSSWRLRARWRFCGGARRC